MNLYMGISNDGLMFTGAIVCSRQWKWNNLVSTATIMQNYNKAYLSLNRVHV